MIKSIFKTYAGSLSTFLGVLSYFACVYIFQIFLSRIGYPVILPNAATLSRWDANIYMQVANRGYVFTTLSETNTGVFVLFPIIWHLLHVVR